MKMAKLLSLLITSCLFLPSDLWALQVGSGSISGTFHDATTTTHTSGEPIVLSDQLAEGLSSSEVFEIWAASPIPTGTRMSASLPIANGAGSADYQWGLQFNGGGNFNWPTRFVVGGTTYDAAGFLDLFDEDDGFVGGEVDRIFDLSSNSLAFESDGFSNQIQGETFVAGMLEYSNGNSIIGTEISSVSLTLNTFSDNPLFQQTLEIPIEIRTTPNSSDDFASADFIFFRDRPELGSFRVFEGESTSVEILAEFNSLNLIGFGEVANSDVGFVATSVPEPSGGVLITLGLVCSGAIVRRRKYSNF